MSDPTAITVPFMLMFFAAMGAFVAARFLKHQEIMTYAKQGMYPPEQLMRSNRMGPTPRMRQGIITTMIGTMLIFGLSTIGFGPWLMGGLIPFGIGLALMIIGRMEMTAAELPPNYNFGEGESEEVETHEPIPANKREHL